MYSLILVVVVGIIVDKIPIVSVLDTLSYIDLPPDSLKPRHNTRPTDDSGFHGEVGHSSSVLDAGHHCQRLLFGGTDAYVDAFYIGVYA